MFAAGDRQPGGQEGAGQDRRRGATSTHGIARDGPGAGPHQEPQGFKYSTTRRHHGGRVSDISRAARKGPAPARRPTIRWPRSTACTAWVCSPTDERYSTASSISGTPTTDQPGAAGLCRRLDKFNPIRMMADSGARGSTAQIQPAGRHARPDGRPLSGKTHRIAHPRELPRGPQGAGVLPNLPRQPARAWPTRPFVPPTRAT